MLVTQVRHEHVLQVAGVKGRRGERRTSSSRAINLLAEGSQKAKRDSRNYLITRESSISSFAALLFKEDISEREERGRFLMDRVIGAEHRANSSMKSKAERAGRNAEYSQRVYEVFNEISKERERRGINNFVNSMAVSA